MHAHAYICAARLLGDHTNIPPLGQPAFRFPGLLCPWLFLFLQIAFCYCFTDKCTAREAGSSDHTPSFLPARLQTLNLKFATLCSEPNAAVSRPPLGHVWRLCRLHHATAQSRTSGAWVVGRGKSRGAVLFRCQQNKGSAGETCGVGRHLLAADRARSVGKYCATAAAPLQHAPQPCRRPLLLQPRVLLLLGAAAHAAPLWLHGRARTLRRWQLPLGRLLQRMPQTRICPWPGRLHEKVKSMWWWRCQRQCAGGSGGSSNSSSSTPARTPTCIRQRHQPQRIVGMHVHPCVVAHQARSKPRQQRRQHLTQGLRGKGGQVGFTVAQHWQSAHLSVMAAWSVCKRGVTQRSWGVLEQLLCPLN